MGDKLELAVTTLLTSVAFKFVTANYLPQIPYLTLIDKFVLMCNGVILLAFALHGLMGCLVNWIEIPSNLVDITNKVSVGLVVVVWGAVQTWFIYAIRSAIVSVSQPSPLRRRRAAGEPDHLHSRAITSALRVCALNTCAHKMFLGQHLSVHVADNP